MSSELEKSRSTRTCGAARSARRPVKPEVAGSNPVRSARWVRDIAGATAVPSPGDVRRKPWGRVAQLVERAPEKREVTGSMPVPTTGRGVGLPRPFANRDSIWLYRMVKRYRHTES